MDPEFTSEFLTTVLTARNGTLLGVQNFPLDAYFLGNLDPNGSVCAPLVQRLRGIIWQEWYISPRTILDVSGYRNNYRKIILHNYPNWSILPMT